MTDSHRRPASAAGADSAATAPWATTRAGAPEGTASDDVTGAAATAGGKRRLVGIDAARGLALIGMVSIHILPAWDPETFAPTAQWTLFAGRSAALFALLAGVSLAFFVLAIPFLGLSARALFAWRASRCRSACCCWASGSPWWRGWPTGC